MYFYFLLCKYKPIKLFIMKKLMLFALVASVTTGYSQDAGIPNVKIKTKSYRTYETVEYVAIDSTWSEYDSLTIELGKCQALVYGYEDTTSGAWSYNWDDVERMRDYRTRKETFSFNFKDSTLTRVSLTSFHVDHISYFFKEYGEPDKYQIGVITQNGYDRAYYINFTKRTLECYVYNKKPINFLGMAGVRRFTTSKFITKNKFVNQLDL